ncbi:MAG: AbrB/MazE/SpoVT family DNA-binding domain-containing protein [Candidatus Pacearchaeota archaeon]|jgi:AbrB family looped-hinge helix DNA binding protein
MENVEITSVSSRGQIVIPQNLRNKMNIREGEKFIVIGEDNTIVLKKLEMPSFSGIDKLLEKTRDFAKKKELKESDITDAIKNQRKK